MSGLLGSAYLDSPPAQDRVGEQRAAIFAEAEERFGAFIREQVNPGSRERDRLGTPLSRAICREAVRLGLANYHAPADVGGGGASVPAWGLLLEWVGYTCDDLALPVLLGYRQTLCQLLCELGRGRLPGMREPRPDVIARYVEPMVAGERFMSVAYTEGADPFSFRSTARAVAGGYVLHGTKSMITGGLTADWIATFAANKDNDLMLFIIDREDAGVTLAPRDLMGMRSLGVASMDLDGVFVAADRALIVTDGITCGQRFFNDRRLNAPCGALGRIQRIFEHCIEDLSQRIRYQLPVSEMQAVQARLGRMHVAVETARTVLYAALARAACGAHDTVWDPPITISKYFVVQQAEAVAREATYIMGGAAYDRAQPYERALRDLHALIHIAGTQATLETDLGVNAISAVTQRMLRTQRRSGTSGSGDSGR